MLRVARNRASLKTYLLFLYLTIHTSNVYKYSLQYFNSPAVKYYFDISEEGNVRFFEVNLKDGILNKYKNINRTSVTIHLKIITI